MKIKGNKKPFGGVHVILVGDLFQLKPVFGSWVFKNSDTLASEALSPNLWREHFTVYELTKVMRRKEDEKFAHLLNRLREGTHTENDLTDLKSCIVKQNDTKYNKTAPHFFRSRREVMDHNNKIFAAATTEKTSIDAHDAVVGDTLKKVADRIQSRIQKNQQDATHSNSHNTANLEDRLDVAVSLRYHVTINVDVEDGITNGADCVLKKIQYLEQNRQVPSVLWVLFDDHKIGRHTRRMYSSYFSPDINKKWTPIFDVNRN